MTGRKLKMAEVMTRLTKKKKKLNEQSDKLSGDINEKDDVLRSFNFGLPVWPGSSCQIGKEWVVTDTTASGEEVRYAHWIELGYDKVYGEWSLATRHQMMRVVYDGAGDPDYLEPCETVSTIPLKDNTRERKIKALEKIPVLMEAILEAVENAVDKMAEFEGERVEILEAFKQKK